MAGVDPDAVSRAVGYPYARPAGSYRFHLPTGAFEPIAQPGADLAVGRTAVLAIGSNAAPGQLWRKYRGVADCEEWLPVLSAQVREHDVVYAALLATYGSVPATLVESPGTSCQIHLTLLAPRQREVMDRSEDLGGAYTLVEIGAGLVTVDRGLEPRDLGAVPVLAYVATAGPMTLDGTSVALAAIAASSRRFRALTQREVLERLGQRMGWTVEQLVERATSDTDVRRQVATHLADL